MTDFDYYLTFGKRYLAMSVLAYIIGAYTALNINTNIDFSTFTIYSASYAAAVAIICVPFLLLNIKRDTKYLILGCLFLTVIFILGFSRTVMYINSIKRTQELFDDRVTICGVVKSEPSLSSSEKTVEFDVKVYEIKDSLALKNPIKIRLYSNIDYFNHDIKYGSKIMCSVKRMNDKPAFKGAFSYSRYLLQNDIICYGFVKLIKPIDLPMADSSPLDKFENFGFKLRTHILNICENSPCGNDEKALLKGILIGDRDGFSEDLYSRYSNSGFMHIAAVSGMHTSYLLLLISSILGIFRFPKRFICIPAIPLLVLFAAVALFTPSVCRAVIMMSVMLFAAAVRRRNDSITTLSVAALILVIHNPYSLESASFLMSFGATLAILVFYSPIRSRLNCIVTDKPTSETTGNKFKHFTPCVTNKLTGYIAQSISLSLCGTLGLSYFTARMFGIIQWGSIVGSIFVLPVMAMVFITGYANCLVSLIYKPLSNLIFKLILNPALWFINACAGFFSKSIFRINTYTPPKSFFIIFLIFCIGTYILLIPSKNKISDTDNDID